MRHLFSSFETSFRPTRSLPFLLLTHEPFAPGFTSIPLVRQHLRSVNNPFRAGQMQQDNKVISFEAKHIKFTLQSGWESFAAVYKISLQ